MKRLLFALLAACCLSSNVSADDLMEVTLRNGDDARLVQNTSTAVTAVDRNVYLILAGPGVRDVVEASGLDYREILRDADRDHLAIDRRPIHIDVPGQAVVYERNGLRLLLTSHNLALATSDADLLPIDARPVVVRYLAWGSPLTAPSALSTSADSLIELISEDSLRAYTERLQAFFRRVAGSDSSRAARDWIESKFRSFGYDSVVIDEFIGRSLATGALLPCFNIVACLPGQDGSRFQIVIGGHYDAVPASPGADDNASGTAATIELARALARSGLPMTIKFIAFDSEESGLRGSRHYADSIADHGEDVVLMINLDMIAHHSNISRANLYHSVEDVYARLWAQLGPTYGILTTNFGFSGASDHASFSNNGYDVIFVQEGGRSTEYHMPSDSTTYLNFEYMSRMVKATLHTAFCVAEVPPPVRITAVLEPGDGHSQDLFWDPAHSGSIDHVRLTWHPTANPSADHSVHLSPEDTSFTVTGLSENVPYTFFIQAIDTLSRTSYAAKEAFGTPRSVPLPPAGLSARPIYHGVRLSWQRNNTEMDLSHYSIVRDGIFVTTTNDTTFDDLDPDLGSSLHNYHVLATDFTFKCSDTSDILPAVSRAATLEPNRVLAVNRSSTAGGIWVKETETGVFLRDALAIFDSDYRSDTAALSHQEGSVALFDLLSHGVLVIGDESGRGMDISKSPAEGGILDDLTYYCSIGGKLIIFGRFGTLTAGDTVEYTAGSSYDDAFASTFHIGERIRTRSLLLSPNLVTGDLVGADPLLPGYPVLVWDSALTAAHSSPLLAPFGIPMASHVELNNPDAHPLYSYRSAYDTSDSNGGTVGWYYFGPDHKYIFFDIPLSFCERTAAIETLRKAVNDLMSQPTDIDDDPAPLPGRFTLAQNYPNPFNATTTIAYTLPAAGPVKLTIYNLLGQTVAFWNWERQSAGRHSVTWNGMNSANRPVATGVYFYRLETCDHVATKKMLLLK